MSYLAPRFTPKTGEDNTPAGKAGLVAAAAHELSSKLEDLAGNMIHLASAMAASAKETQQLQDRDQQARDRLEDVQRLFWTWVQQLQRGVISEEEGVLDDCIEKLGTVLGLDMSPDGDMHPANVTLELQKRGLA